MGLPPLEKVKCPHCGQEVLKGAYKCGKCGKPLAGIKPAPSDSQAGTVKCPKCGLQVRKGAYKCAACGTVISPLASPAAAAAKPKSSCPHCGKEILKGASKCPNCGKTISITHLQEPSVKPADKISEPPGPGQPEQKAPPAPARAAAPPIDDKHCPNCGKEVPAGKSFCAFCGTRLLRKPAAAAAAAPEETESPEVVPLDPQILGISLGALIVAVLTMVFNLASHKVWIAAIPALVALGLSAFALVKNQLHGPGRIKLISAFAIVLAIISLLSALAGLILFILAGTVAGLLGLFILLQHKFGRTTALSIVVVSAFGFLIVFGFFVEKIAGFFLQKPSSEEARWNLVTFSRAQTIYYAHNRVFATSFEDMGYELRNQKYYAYFISPEKSYQPKDKTFKLPKNVEPYISESGYNFCAVGQLDDDPTLDVWCLEAGSVPVHVINDLER